MSKPRPFVRARLAWLLSGLMLSAVAGDWDEARRRASKIVELLQGVLEAQEAEAVDDQPQPQSHVWYLSHHADAVTLIPSFEARGELRPPFHRQVRPGESYLGLDYDQWRALPAGKVRLTYADGEPARFEGAGDADG